MKNLNDALDQLNEEIDEVEHYIERLELGEAAEVPCEDGGKVGFHKMNGVWRLTYTGPNALEAGPLRNVSKQVRIEVCRSEAITDLIATLHATAALRLGQVDEAIACMKQIRGAT